MKNIFLACLLACASVAILTPASAEIIGGTPIPGNPTVGRGTDLSVD